MSLKQIYWSKGTSFSFGFAIKQPTHKHMIPQKQMTTNTQLKQKPTTSNQCSISVNQFSIKKKRHWLNGYYGNDVNYPNETPQTQCRYLHLHRYRFCHFPRDSPRCGGFGTAWPHSWCWPLGCIYQAGRCETSTLLSLHDGTLSTAMHRGVHSEVVDAVPGAGEDAWLRTGAVSLIEQHSGEHQDSRVTAGAVTDVQFGCEGPSA